MTTTIVRSYRSLSTSQNPNSNYHILIPESEPDNVLFPIISITEVDHHLQERSTQQVEREPLIQSLKSINSSESTLIQSRSDDEDLNYYGWTDGSSVRTLQSDISNDSINSLSKNHDVDGQESKVDTRGEDEDDKPFPWKDMWPVLLLNPVQPIAFELVFPFVSE
jgi:hypothetical protein